MRTSSRIIVVGTVLLVGVAALGMSLASAHGNVARINAAAACRAVTTAIFIPVQGSPLNDITIDPDCTYVYASNQTQNRIEVFSLASMSLEEPILVGASPAGFDITPDGRTMYVANKGGANISVVDLESKTELRRISVPPSHSIDRPHSIAIASNGKAVFTTTWDGSGAAARIMTLDLATDGLAVADCHGGLTDVATFAEASQDRNKVGLVVGNSSAGPVLLYSASEGRCTHRVELGAFGYARYLAVDATGSNFIASQHGYALDGQLMIKGSFTRGGFGVALKPAGDFGFRAQRSGIEILEMEHFTVRGLIPVPDTIGSPHPATGPARMAISGDGSLLALNTDNGFVIVSATTEPPPTPTATATATATASPRPQPTATPVVGGGFSPVQAAFGSVLFGPGITDSVAVAFDRPLRSTDYAILVTPVDRLCVPIVRDKTMKGFVIECSGQGGGVDWAVMTSPSKQR